MTCDAVIGPELWRTCPPAGLFMINAGAFDGKVQWKTMGIWGSYRLEVRTVVSFYDDLKKIFYNRLTKRSPDDVKWYDCSKSTMSYDDNALHFVILRYHLLSIRANNFVGYSYLYTKTQCFAKLLILSCLYSIEYSHNYYPLRLYCWRKLQVSTCEF